MQNRRSFATRFGIEQFVHIHSVDNKVVQLEDNLADAVACRSIEVSRITSFRDFDLRSCLSNVNKCATSPCVLCSG
jgi:hypothetical protein